MVRPEVLRARYRVTPSRSAAGFDVLVTTDRNIRYQQKLTNRKIAIVVLSKERWRLVREKLPEIAAAVDAATPGSVVEIQIPVD